MRTDDPERWQGHHLVGGAAEAFLATCAGGLDTAMRIDVALVDRQGRIEVLENATLG